MEGLFSPIRARNDGRQLVVSQLGSWTRRRGILDLHALRQYGRNDLKVVLRTLGADLLNHVLAVGLEVLRQSMQKCLVEFVARPLGSSRWIANLTVV
jgi:hypothetical protein